MKCWLDLLVAGDDFVDNARPAFLGNPLSRDPLEFDRYYLDGVRFEFNGPSTTAPLRRSRTSRRFGRCEPGIS
ncbi:MAG: hypothetical protein AB1609_18860 [Bacillota bacterium]